MADCAGMNAHVRQNWRIIASNVQRHPVAVPVYRRRDHESEARGTANAGTRDHVDAHGAVLLTSCAVAFSAGVVHAADVVIWMMLLFSAHPWLGLICSGVFVVELLLFHTGWRCDLKGEGHSTG